MDVGGAYGGGKAGAPFDPITFVQRPQVILRGVCLLFSLITFGCVSGKGYVDGDDGKEYCIYNDDASACSFGKTVGFIALAASIGFLGGEYLFEQMSSVKTRKHYVLGDLGVSGFWAFLHFIAFWYLTSAWNKAPVPKSGEGTTSANLACFFFFVSIFVWAACAYLAYLRFKQGTEAAFAPSYEADPMGSTGGQGYTSYPDATDAAYQEPPFGQQQQRAMGDFQAPAY